MMMQTASKAYPTAVPRGDGYSGKDTRNTQHVAKPVTGTTNKLERSDTSDTLLKLIISKGSTACADIVAATVSPTNLGNLLE